MTLVASPRPFSTKAVIALHHFTTLFGRYLAYLSCHSFSHLNLTITAYAKHWGGASKTERVKPVTWVLNGKMICFTFVWRFEGSFIRVV